MRTITVPTLYIENEHLIGMILNYLSVLLVGVRVARLVNLRPSILIGQHKIDSSYSRYATGHITYKLHNYIKECAHFKCITITMISP